MGFDKEQSDEERSAKLDARGRFCDEERSAKLDARGRFCDEERDATAARNPPIKITMKQSSLKKSPTLKNGK